MEYPDELHCETCNTTSKISETTPKCLNCDHAFCRTCITTLTSTKIQCPKCKTTISVLSAEDIDQFNGNKRVVPVNSSGDLSILNDDNSSSKEEQKMEQNSTSEQRSVGSDSSDSNSSIKQSMETNLVNPISDDCENLITSKDMTYDCDNPIIIVQDFSISETVDQNLERVDILGKNYVANSNDNLLKTTDIEKNSSPGLFLDCFDVQNECDNKTVSENITVQPVDGQLISNDNRDSTDKSNFCDNNDHRIKLEIGSTKIKQHEGFDKLQETEMKSEIGCTKVKQHEGFDKLQETEMKYEIGCTKIKQQEGFDKLQETEMKSEIGCTKIKQEEEFDKLQETEMKYEIGSIKQHEGFDKLQETEMKSEIGSIKQHEGFDKLQETEIQRYSDEIQILHEVLETVDDAILTLKVELKQHEDKKKDLMEMVKEEEKNLEITKVKIEEALKNKKCVEEVTNKLRDVEESIAKTQSLESLRSTVEMDSANMAHAEELGMQVEIHYMHFLLSRDVQKPEYIERMIDLGVKIFAEHQVDGKWKWGRISLVDNMIHIHALDTNAPPSDCYLLPWNCLKSMVSAQKASTFLDIKLGGEYLGRVYMSMFGDTPRVQQYVILSSGEEAYCYKGSKMKQLGNKNQPGEYVSFHGPKNKKGSPIRGVVPGITQGGVYTRRKYPGLLAGAALTHRQRTLFVVYLQEDPDEDTTGAFGEVVKGLDILKTASIHEPSNEVSISDCGVIIPLA